MDGWMDPIIKPITVLDIDKVGNLISGSNAKPS